MGKLSRTKGAAFERRIARWLSRILGIEVWRQTDETQQGNMGDVRIALAEPAAAHPLLQHGQLVIQAKHMKQPSPWRALGEAEDAAGDNFPVACIRRHGGEDIVVMRPDVFAWLLTGNRSDWSKD